MDNFMRKVIRKEVTCPQCKGKGVVYDHELSVFTFGIGAILQACSDNLKMRCPKCKGHGVILRKIGITEN